MSKTWDLYVDSKYVGLIELNEFSNWGKLVMSDTNGKFEALPWDKCKPYNGVSVFYRGDAIDAVTCAGVLLTKNIINNPKTWTIGHSAASYAFVWLEQIKNNVDAWIDAELAKLKEKERAKAEKLAPPVPPDGYRLCSSDEAANAPSWLAKIWIDGEWCSAGDTLLVNKMFMAERDDGFYCTSAPRKFVRCTPEDADRLFSAGAYVEWWILGNERWGAKDCVGALSPNRYRVDKYTIPAGFELQPVMPTVRLPDGFGWVAIGGKIIAFEKDGLVMEVPSSKYHFDDFLRRQKLRQATLDAYNEIHDGET